MLKICVASVAAMKPVGRRPSFFAFLSISLSLPYRPGDHSPRFRPLASFSGQQGPFKHDGETKPTDFLFVTIFRKIVAL
jgi:hypothetical protein